MNENIKQQIRTGYCADTRDTIVDGNSLSGYRVQSMLVWQACHDRTDSAKPECMSSKEQQDWVRKNNPTAYLIYSHNFVDFDAPNKALKHSAAAEYISSSIHNK